MDDVLNFLMGRKYRRDSNQKGPRPGEMMREYCTRSSILTLERYIMKREGRRKPGEKKVHFSSLHELEGQIDYKVESPVNSLSWGRER